MKKKCLSFFIISSIFIFSASGNQLTKFPYKKAGLTDEQAAAHLLSRFSFGGNFGEAELIAKTGLEVWFESQLKANLPDKEMDKMLDAFDALNLDNKTIVNTYVRPGDIQRELIKSGLLKDTSEVSSNSERRAIINKYIRDNHLKTQQDLYKQLISQKIIRAIYSNNQLQEVMTDFWFNHFNVSLSKGQCAPFVMTYERDAIRPHSLGSFLKILEASAKHPAMLFYLDNASSSSNNNSLSKEKNKSVKNKKKRTEGLNENYARELMELHTMGVDGGYTQADVTEVAKALTGWSVVPLKRDAEKRLEPRDKRKQLEDNGFIVEGDFIFRADKHDEGEKTILGKKFPAGNGYDEGIAVLEILSKHPATAQFICKKLAIRFVSDTPSQKLINFLTSVFTQSHGNIKSVLTALVESEEFWSADVLREKIKTPFELIVSTARATNSIVKQPLRLNTWCTKMGQKIYYYQAPTGFPDKASFWINSGALLNRINFGLAFGTNQIQGTKTDFLSLNNGLEPESPEVALNTYAKILIPGRNIESTITRLSPKLKNPEISKKIEILNTETEDIPDSSKEIKKQPSMDDDINFSVGQIVGLIIGSPEFQRR